MAIAGEHGVVITEILIYCFRLGWRFDDNYVNWVIRILTLFRRGGGFSIWW